MLNEVYLSGPHNDKNISSLNMSCPFDCILNDFVHFDQWNESGVIYLK